MATLQYDSNVCFKPSTIVAKLLKLLPLAKLWSDAIKIKGIKN